MTIKKEFGKKLGWFDWVVFLNQLIAVVIIFFLSFVFFSVQTERQFQKLEPYMDKLAALVSTATEEEYTEIAEELRHSLILRTLNKKDQVYIDLIPNMAEACPLDGEYGPNFGPIYMASLNTGALYDLTSQSQTPTGDGAADVRFGYDGVSGSQMMLCRSSDGSSEVSLHREEGVVSIHRMKGHFCERCIKSMVEALTNESVLEYIIYDAETGALYAISEGAEYEIGNYMVTVTRESGDRRNDYRIALRPQ